MHDEAFAFVEWAVDTYGPFVSILEVGSRNINGGVRCLFEDAVFEGMDLVAGDGVDVVGDATKEVPAGPYDCVVCCEVFEHEAGWPRIIWNAAASLMPGGVLVVTAAGPGRTPHSAIDGGHVRPGEFYCNVRPEELMEHAYAAGLTVKQLEANAAAGDVYLVAKKEA